MGSLLLFSSYGPEIIKNRPFYIVFHWYHQAKYVRESYVLRYILKISQQVSYYKKWKKKKLKLVKIGKTAGKANIH